ADRDGEQRFHAGLVCADGVEMKEIGLFVPEEESGFVPTVMLSPQRGRGQAKGSRLAGPAKSITVVVLCRDFLGRGGPCGVLPFTGRRRRHLALSDVDGLAF